MPHRARTPDWQTLGRPATHTFEPPRGQWSGFFDTMLSGEWAEASAREVTIDLPADGFDELLGFCYTGRVSVHKGNVGALLRLSTFLQVRELEELCCGFLLGQPPPGEPSASGLCQ